MEPGVLWRNFNGDPTVGNHRFMPYFDAKSLPRTPGIFVVLCGTGSEWYVLDIDYACDIAVAFFEHPRVACWNRQWGRYGIPAFAVHQTFFEGYSLEEGLREIKNAFPGRPCS